MNTDNTSISGETLDYGPCAFMDAYDPNTVFSFIDRQGRYAFGNQPRIALWNLTRLAEALFPLLQEEGGGEEAALSSATEALTAFAPQFEAAHWTGLRRKLGLFTEASACSTAATPTVWLQDRLVSFMPAPIPSAVCSSPATPRPESRPSPGLTSMRGALREWRRAHPLQSTQQAGYIHDSKVQWGRAALHEEAGTERSDEDEQRERSFGHGIGMCQHGAAGMAREGADFRSILLHYYPNATLFSSR